MTTAAVLDAPVNVFSDYQDKVWPYRYRGRLRFRDLVLGGTPTDDKVAKGWLSKKLGDKDEAIMKMVADVMADRAIDREEALKIVGDLKLLKGFRKDSTGLFLESRVLKSNFKEGCAVGQAAGHISNKREFGVGTKAGVRNFVAEHVMIVENKLYLLRDNQPLHKPDGIQQRFVHVYNGSGITYEEYLERVEIEFTLITDYEFPDDFFPVAWLKAAEQGLGATRSQGFGRYTMVAWDRL